MTIQTAGNRLSPAQAAHLIGVKPETLAVWRCTKRHDLTYVKIGTKISYKIEDVQAFIEDHTVKQNEGAK